MGRYCHHCTAAVARQDKVGCPDRDRFPCERMNHFDTQRIPLFVCLGSLPLCSICYPGDRLSCLRLQQGIVNEILCDRMLCGQCAIGHTIDRIRACRKDFISVKLSTQLCFTLRSEFKSKWQTLRFSDPIALHGQDLTGPLPLQLLQILKKLISIFDNIDIVSWHLLELYLSAATPAASFFDLFICQYRMTGLTPVDSGRFAIKQPLLIHFDDKCLFPAAIKFITRCKLTGFGKWEAQRS